MIEIVTIVTNKAKENLAYNTIDGSAFKVTHFEFGSGGFNGSTVIAADPNGVALYQPLGEGKHLIPESSGHVIANSPVWKLEASQIQGSISEIGLWAQKVSKLGPTYKAAEFVANSYFLYAHGTFEVKNINASEVIELEIQIQY